MRWTRCEYNNNKQTNETMFSLQFMKPTHFIAVLDSFNA